LATVVEVMQPVARRPLGHSVAPLVALLELLALLSYRLGGLVVRALAGISTFLAALVVPVFLAAAALHRAQEAEEAEPVARPDQMAFLLLF
jgi:hypothetical protein